MLTYANKIGSNDFDLCQIPHSSQRHGHMEPLMLWHRSSRGPKLHWALKSALAEAREVQK